MTTKSQLREQILKRHGLVTGKYGQLKQRVAQRPADNKTWAMLALELRFGKDIEELLSPGTNINTVARRLSIDKGTVSKWRLRFGLR